MSTPTKSAIAWNNAREVYRVASDAYHATAQAEFPPGTQVTWTHSYDREHNPVKRAGKIMDVRGGKARIHMKPGGPNHYIDCWMLESAP